MKEYFSRQDKLHSSYLFMCMIPLSAIAIVTGFLVFFVIRKFTDDPVVCGVLLCTTFFFVPLISYALLFQNKRPASADEIHRTVKIITEDDISGAGVRFIWAIIESRLVLRRYHLSKAFDLVNEHKRSVEKKEEESLKELATNEIIVMLRDHKKVTR